MSVDEYYNSGPLCVDWYIRKWWWIIDEFSKEKACSVNTYSSVTAYLVYILFWSRDREIWKFLLHFKSNSSIARDFKGLRRTNHFHLPWCFQRWFQDHHKWTLWKRPMKKEEHFVFSNLHSQFAFWLCNDLCSQSDDLINLWLSHF